MCFKSDTLLFMDTLSLNRPWKFRLDPKNVGLSEAWYSNTRILETGSIDINVPSCWEELEQDYEGVAWYSTQVDIDTDKAGQICRIVFQASNYRTGIWINGKAAGSHDGGYTPFDFEIQDFLNYGASNQLTVRIVSPIITKDIRVDDLGPNDMPHWRGGLTAGIWQSATLEFNQSAWIKHTFYKPKIKDSTFGLDLELRCNETTSQAAILKIDVCDNKGESVYQNEQSFQLQEGDIQLEHTIALPDAKLWTCESPHLYTAHARILLNGKEIAESIERIGLREFTYENERFCLNGERIYLRGGFWEGVYAKHQSYPESRDEVRRERGGRCGARDEARRRGRIRRCVSRRVVTARGHLRRGGRRLRHGCRRARRDPHLVRQAEAPETVADPERRGARVWRPRAARAAARPGPDGGERRGALGAGVGPEGVRRVRHGQG